MMMSTFAAELEKAKNKRKEGEKMSSESIQIVKNLITMCNSEKLYSEFDRKLFKNMLELILDNEGVK